MTIQERVIERTKSKELEAANDSLQKMIDKIGDQLAETQIDLQEARSKYDFQVQQCNIAQQAYYDLSNGKDGKMYWRNLYYTAKKEYDVLLNQMNMRTLLPPPPPKEERREYKNSNDFGYGNTTDYDIGEM